MNEVQKAAYGTLLALAQQCGLPCASEVTPEGNLVYLHLGIKPKPLVKTEEYVLFRAAVIQFFVHSFLVGFKSPHVHVLYNDTWELVDSYADYYKEKFEDPWTPRDAFWKMLNDEPLLLRDVELIDIGITELLNAMGECNPYNEERSDAFEFFPHEYHDSYVFLLNLLGLTDVLTYDADPNLTNLSDAPEYKAWAAEDAAATEILQETQNNLRNLLEHESFTVLL